MPSSHLMPIRNPHNQPVRNPHIESSKKPRTTKNPILTKKKIIWIAVLLGLSYVFVKAFSY